MPSSQAIKGNQNQQLSIDTVHLHTSPERALQKTMIHDLLVLIYKRIPDEGVKNQDFNLDPPVEIKNKLNFNNAFRYRKIFNGVIPTSQKIDDTLSDFERSELLVKSVSDSYQKIAIDFDFMPPSNDATRGETSGDKILLQLEQQITHQIEGDPEFQSKEYTRETVTVFVQALIYYCLELCKVLEKPEE